MAWLETDRHGRLRIAFKYYDGRTYREPLGVEASKRTRVDAERLSSTIQLELSWPAPRKLRRNEVESVA